MHAKHGSCFGPHSPEPITPSKLPLAPLPHARFMRQKLELDLIACKAWLRSAEDKEKEYKGAAAEAAEAKEQLRVQASLVEELQAQVSRAVGSRSGGGERRGRMG